MHDRITDAQSAIAAEMTERVLYENVRELALRLGWLIYHTYDSRRSYPGFPDLVLVKPPRVLFVELKREHGRLSRDQQRWLEALSACPGVETYVWRPRDWISGAIEAALQSDLLFDAASQQTTAPAGSEER